MKEIVLFREDLFKKLQRHTIYSSPSNNVENSNNMESGNLSQELDPSQDIFSQFSGISSHHHDVDIENNKTGNDHPDITEQLVQTVLDQVFLPVYFHMIWSH